MEDSGESVSVQVHVEIDGEVAVSEVYTCNSRARAAADLQDMAEKIDGFGGGDD